MDAGFVRFLTLAGEEGNLFSSGEIPLFVEGGKNTA